MGKITKKELKQVNTLFPKNDSDKFLEHNWCLEREGIKAVVRAQARHIMKLTAAAKEILRKEGIGVPSLEDEPYSIEVIDALCFLRDIEKKKKSSPMEIKDFFSIEETPANNSRGLFHEAGNIVQENSGGSGSGGI